MGGCASKEEGAAGNSGAGEDSQALMQEVKKSRLIDKQLKEDARRMQRELKLLLLGAGESGKTTVLKQMKLIHANGFEDHEVEYYRKQIFDNLCDAVRQVAYAADDWEISFTPETMEYIKLLDEDKLLDDQEPYPIEYKEVLSRFWTDPGVRQTLLRANEAPIPENVNYFFPELDRLFALDYTPTDQDILRARGKTTGISETQFMSRDHIYSLCDVGGQRSERKKWIHCFEDVTAVLFLVALSGYDQCLLEDQDSNMTQEALMLFDGICNSKWFAKTSMILFLNKTDLFKLKIHQSDLKRYFPDYQGLSTDYNATRLYFKNKFERLNRSKEKEVYVHYTCAVDTKALKVVMASVQDIIITKNLQDFAL